MVDLAIRAGPVFFGFFSAFAIVVIVITISMFSRSQCFFELISIT